MLTIYICRGLPASGKSTWAKELVKKAPNTHKRINKDDLRAMLDDSQWSSDNEKFVLQIRDDLILKALERGKHVIVDDTNLHPKHEIRIKDIAKQFTEKTGTEVKVEVVDFTHVPVEECIRRDLIRPNSVGHKVIWGMYRQFLQVKKEIPKIIRDPNLPSAIICDLDGTLAKLNGRNPYDATTCENDILNEAVNAVLQWAYIGRIKVLLVSGRTDKYETQTLAFLKKNNVAFDLLKMRKEGDERKDAIIKEEIYNEFIKDKYNVLFVMDDRNQVVDFWRSVGLTCFQVDYGDF